MDLVALGQSIGVEGFMHPAEIHKLVELAANRHVLEVGSYRGLSAWAMCISARSVTCVDTFGAASDGQRQTGGLTTLDAFLAATRRFSNVEHVVSDSLAADLPGMFDLIFLDATHTYDALKADIQKWLPKLNKGGILAFHDYRHHDFPGVEQAVDEFFGPAPEGTTVITLRWIENPPSV